MDASGGVRTWSPASTVHVGAMIIVLAGPQSAPVNCWVNCHTSIPGSRLHCGDCSARPLHVP
jgi:hypothetical protein